MLVETFGERFSYIYAARCVRGWTRRPNRPNKKSVRTTTSVQS